MTAAPSSLSAATHAKSKRRLRTWQLVVLWLVCMAPLRLWGLPSSADDVLLFGGQPPWPPERYGSAAAARERRARAAGADVDLNPIEVRDRVVDLTGDERARGEILTRYRLYSRQPDEMITFMALQRMDPRRLDLDPRLYQYCGGYIYLIGAAVGIGSLVGVTTVTSDIDVYLAQPELFARFYLVGRGVTLVFGAALLVAAVHLARRAAGRTAGWIAFVLVAASPVFITGVLEAKPHLPSVCLLLWATLAALEYLAGGARRDALRMGLLAGGAFSLVLTGLVAAILWPVLLVARKPLTRRAAVDMLLAALGAIGVYLVTNPYVPYNALFNRAALQSNLANSTAMYRVGELAGGALRVGELLIESVGLAVPIVGLLALAWLARRYPRQAATSAAMGVVVLLLGAAIGAGKPAEFARFLLLPVVLLCVAAAAAVARLGFRRPLAALVLAVLVLAVMKTPAYIRSFATEARGEHESRHTAARFIHDYVPVDEPIGVVQVPAPYAVPPIDFAHRTVLLLPPTPPAGDDSTLPRRLVLTADDATVHQTAWWQARYELQRQFPEPTTVLSRIAWASKPVFVYRLRE